MQFGAKSFKFYRESFAKGEFLTRNAEKYEIVKMQLIDELAKKATSDVEVHEAVTTEKDVEDTGISLVRINALCKKVCLNHTPT